MITSPPVRISSPGSALPPMWPLQYPVAGPITRPPSRSALAVPEE